MTLLGRDIDEWTITFVYTGLHASIDDPAVGIRWPLPPGEMSARDRELPRLRREDLDG